VLQQRRHHQFETVASSTVEQIATEFLDAPSLGRQDVGNVLGQQPSRRHVNNRGD
jgi:hypothetical protein